MQQKGAASWCLQKLRLLSKMREGRPQQSADLSVCDESFPSASCSSAAPADQTLPSSTLTRRTCVMLNHLQIAVLKEVDGRGPFCSLVMAVVVVKDVVVIVAFALNMELIRAVSGSQSACVWERILHS